MRRQSFSLWLIFCLLSIPRVCRADAEDFIATAIGGGCSAKFEQSVRRGTICNFYPCSSLAGIAKYQLEFRPLNSKRWHELSLFHDFDSPSSPFSCDGIKSHVSVRVTSSGDYRIRYLIPSQFDNIGGYPPGFYYSPQSVVYGPVQNNRNGEFDCPYARQPYRCTYIRILGK